MTASLYFDDREFTPSKMKDHHISATLNKQTGNMKFKIPLEMLNENKFTLSANKKYYLLEVNTILNYPGREQLTFQLRIAVEKEVHDRKKSDIPKMIT